MGWPRQHARISTGRFLVFLSLVISVSVASEQASGPLPPNYLASDNNLPHETSESFAVNVANDARYFKPEEEKQRLDGGDVLRPKRSGHNWSNLRGSWGKKDASSSATGWNNFRGAWGKKADWSSLRGSWGKRSPGAETLKRADWSNLRGSWGKREDQAEGPAVSLEEEVAKRARWSNLQGSWGKRNFWEEDPMAPSRSWEGDQFDYDSEDEELLANVLAEPLPSRKELLFEAMKMLSQRGGNKEITGEEALDTEGSQYSVNKRSPSQAGGWLKRPEGTFLLAPRSVNWSSLRGSWGKRSGANKWNNMRGMWGKRLDNWNSLRGTWGKRPSQATSWNNLRGTWGKRPSQATSWSNLRGAWGKKSSGNWNSLRGTWGKRDLPADGLDSDGDGGEE